jgi:hypothetical protein
VVFELLIDDVTVLLGGLLFVDRALRVCVLVETGETVATGLALAVFVEIAVGVERGVGPTDFVEVVLGVTREVGKLVFVEVVVFVDVLEAVVVELSAIPLSIRILSDCCEPTKATNKTIHRISTRYL